MEELVIYLFNKHYNGDYRQYENIPLEIFKKMVEIQQIDCHSCEVLLERPEYADHISDTHIHRLFSSEDVYPEDVDESNISLIVKYNPHLYTIYHGFYLFADREERYPVCIANSSLELLNYQDESIVERCINGTMTIDDLDNTSNSEVIHLVRSRLPLVISPRCKTDMDFLS